MLSLTIFLPLLSGLIALMIPRTRPDIVRLVVLGGSLLTLAAALGLWAGFNSGGGALRWRVTLPWINSIGAGYDIGVSGVSLALIVLTAVLLSVTSLCTLREHDRAHAHGFLFMLLGTGLIGLFAAQDLLLFYLFFEVALVPMYFIVGIWGGPRRRYAAMKFFIYTRVGSLAMLLGFLALYLAMQPHSFSLPAIIRAQPLAHAPLGSALVFFALLIGFGVKLPIVPLHNWLPDTHVEAPTEGSIVLAGLQLKMGAYGLIAILLPVLPGAAARFGWLLIGIALVSLIYGSLAALAQRDMKRLVAYTSINHMGFVTLALGIAGLTADPGIRQLALTGATVQMVSHGLLTGGLFLMVGLLQHRAGTRDIGGFGGLIGQAPGFSLIFALFAFGSLGLPGLSGFIAEFQVIAASLQISVWVAGAVVLSLILTTGVFLRLLGGLLMGEPSPRSARIGPLTARDLWAAGGLAALAVLIGIAPGTLIGLINSATHMLARF